MGSVFELMGVDLPVPDHTTVNRRALRMPLISLGRLPMAPAYSDRQHRLESLCCWRVAEGDANAQDDNLLFEMSSFEQFVPAF